MRDDERFRLWHGPYASPRFRYGRVAQCEVRGEVTIVGLTDAPIPWPIGIRGGNRSLVVYGDLAKAVRLEANQAVAHWWGVTPQTVTKWRRAIGVGPTTEGTSRLRSAYTQEEWFAEGAAKARAKAGDPERRAKIAAAKRGKRRPRHVVEAMRRGRTGKPHAPEARAKMSAAAKRRAAAEGRPGLDRRGGRAAPHAAGRRGGRADGADAGSGVLAAARAGAAGRPASSLASPLGCRPTLDTGADAAIIRPFKGEDPEEESAPRGPLTRSTRPSERPTRAVLYAR